MKQLWNRCLSHHLYPKDPGGDIKYINKDNKANSLRSVPLSHIGIPQADLLNGPKAPLIVFASCSKLIFSVFQGQNDDAER